MAFSVLVHDLLVEAHEQLFSINKEKENFLIQLKKKAKPDYLYQWHFTTVIRDQDSSRAGQIIYLNSVQIMY